MIKKSHCKINLSLAVLGRRADGFSDIETVMVPVFGIWDTVSVERADAFAFSSSGIAVDCPVADNLCVRAWRLMEREYALPPVAVHLDKQIPFGAGLGAGSANAAAVIELCDELFELHLSTEKMRLLAGQLGSDTPFFIAPGPMVARGRGELMTPIDLDLRGWWLVLVKPDAGVSTKEAYRAVVPRIPALMPSDAVLLPIEVWKDSCVNDFEQPIFERIPLLGQIKTDLYAAGATFALMSGSGSTIYGLFAQKPNIEFDRFTHIEQL